MSAIKNNPTEAPADRKLVITRVFDAPRRLVFDVWKKKEHLDRWCCPSGFKISHSKGDLRPGGAWESCMISPNGEKHEVTGVYLEIIPNELLIFTHGWLEDDGSRPWETKVTLRFEDEGAKTKMRFEQEVFKSVESRDGHQGGWSQCFDKLAEYLEKSETQAAQ